MYRSAFVVSALASIARGQGASTVFVTPMPLPSATAAAVSCPGSDGTLYTAPSGDQYAIECNIDHYAGDLTYTEVTSFEECILACDENEDCVDVSLSGVACYLKSSVGVSVTKNGIWGARLIVSASSVVAPAPSPSVQSASCPDANGTDYATSTYSRFVIECGSEYAAGDMALQSVDDLAECIELCDETDGCAAVSMIGSQCFLKTSVGAVTYTSEASSARLVTRGPSCPTADGTNGTYTAINGLEFAIECDIDHPGGDLTSQILTGGDGTPWFGECIELCSRTGGCLDISLSGAGCYLKDTLYPASSASGILGARLLSDRPASNAAPSASPRPTPNAVSPVDVGEFEYVACYNDSVNHRVLSSGFLYGSASTGMTAEKCAEYCDDFTYFGLEFSEECYCGSQLLNRPVEMPRSCNMVCGGNSTQICGGDGALSLYRKLGSVSPSVSSSAEESSPSSSEVSSGGPETSISTDEVSPTLATASYPTSTGYPNATSSNSTVLNVTGRYRRRGPKMRPVRLDLNYEI